MPGGGEPGHVDPDLGDDRRGGDRPDAGDVIEAGRRCRERGQIRLDLGVDGGDVGVDRVDARQHPGQQEPVVVVEVAVERLLEEADLGPHPERANCASTLGSRSPPINAAIIGRPDTPKMSEATTESLMQASSSSFSARFFSAVRAATRSIRYRVESRGPADRPRRHKAVRRSICRSATLHSQTASSTSVFGRPGRCLTSRALTSHGCSPCASNR